MTLAKVAETFRMMLRMDPAAKDLWKRRASAFPTGYAVYFFAGRLQGMLYQIGEERIGLETLLEIVEEAMNETA